MSLDVSLEATRTQVVEVFEANVTHNLWQMADAAGIYHCIWRPEESGITTAGDLIAPLTAGLAKLKADPDAFKPYEPSNKWGTYDNFVPWVERYLQACIENPDAKVSASR